MPLSEVFEHQRSLEMVNAMEGYFYWADEVRRKQKENTHGGDWIDEDHEAMASVDNYMRFISSQRGYDTSKTTQSLSGRRR